MSVQFKPVNNSLTILDRRRSRLTALDNTSQPHVVWLNAAPAPRSVVGGKAASLSRLGAFGAPVPPAFALTTHAYAGFAAAHGLPRRAAEIDRTDLDGLREAIMAAPLPAPVAEAVANALREMHARAGGEVALAVRSSGTAEDSAAFSFAGLHDTILDVRSIPALEAALKRCWASLWSDRAVSYRIDGGLDREVSEIAVVVQQLVRSDVSFVAFTAEPVTQDDTRVVIDATWGLGESIVSGLVVPDHITIDASGVVEDYAIGSKQLMVIPGKGPDDGTREVPVPRALQQMPALSNDQATSIANLARMLVDRFGHPLDLEGGLAGGQLHLFQARPITTLGR